MAYCLLEKPADRLIVFGDAHEGSRESGRITFAGWCIGNEEIDLVSVVRDGAVLGSSSALTESTPDIRRPFAANPRSARAVFHISLAGGAIEPGTPVLEFWAVKGDKRGIFWKGPIQIEP